MVTNKTNLADMRRDYSSRDLSELTIDADPFVQFARWFDEALTSEVIEPNAMTLSTVNANRRPSSRVVLLKGLDHRGMVFFTNYESRKASDLLANPHATLHFFWPDLERQIIINGKTEKTSVEESETYFQTRPIASRIGAWASKQSSVLTSRKVLERRVAELTAEFGGREIPLPPFWGGFRVRPYRFEFWQGRPSRLHDRICYELIRNEWTTSRLSP